MKHTQLEMDASAIKAYANDLEGMSLEAIEAEIRDAENKLGEIEPWLEALIARQRQMLPGAEDVRQALNEGWS